MTDPAPAVRSLIDDLVNAGMPRQNAVGLVRQALDDLEPKVCACCWRWAVVKVEREWRCSNHLYVKVTA